MFLLQIKFTPPGRVKCSRQNSDSEKHEPIDVVMAPFSRKSVVQFEDVPVEKTAKRILRISNPTSRDLKVFFFIKHITKTSVYKTGFYKFGS